MAFGALSSGISALNSFSKGMEVIGNNIANVNTVSFKSSRIKYSETFNQVLKQSAPSPSSGDRSNVQASQVGLGVQVEGIVGQFHQGGISSTSQLTDLAISGEGFFMVKDPKTGTQYATRGGDFRIDDQGYLVTSGGMRVQGMTNGSIGFEVDVTADGDWDFSVNEDSQTGTVKPSAYGDIRLDYNKSDAQVVDEAFLSGDQTRNAVMYTNYLVGQTANGGSSYGEIVFKKDSSGNDTNMIDTAATVYGADADNPHRVGSFVYDSITDPEQITAVTGWQAFAEGAVADLKTLRNVSNEGNISGIVTDAEIEKAVSSDFYYRMYGSSITEDNNAIIEEHIDDVVTNWNTANPGNTISATDFLKLESGLDAIESWNALNPSNTISESDLTTIEDVRTAITDWNAANATRTFSDSDLPTIATVQDAIKAWNAANTSAAIEHSDLERVYELSQPGDGFDTSLNGFTYETYENVEGAIAHWNDENPSNTIDYTDLNTGTVSEDVIALWNAEYPSRQLSEAELLTYKGIYSDIASSGGSLTPADAELMIAAGNAVDNWNSLHPTETIDNDDYELLRSANDSIAAWNTANPSDEISLTDLNLVTAAEGAVQNWNTGNPSDNLTVEDFAVINMATEVVNEWNVQNPNETKSVSLLAKGAITLDGNAVRDLFNAASGLSWDNTIDVDATLESILSTLPQNFTEANSMVNAISREQTPELSRFSIDEEGSVIYFLNNGDSFTRGQIQLVDFNDKTALIREGQNLYSSFGAAGLKENPYGANDEGLQVAGTNGLGLIKQGALELSNVDLTNEFANMITTQRGFQAGSRIITVSDDILQEVVNLKR